MLMCMLLILVQCKNLKFGIVLVLFGFVLFCPQKLQVLPEIPHKKEKKPDCPVIFYVTVTLCHNMQENA